MVVGEQAPLNRDIGLRGGSRRRFGCDHRAVFDARSGAVRRAPAVHYVALARGQDEVSKSGRAWATRRQAN
jgi:hypothetical protein